MSEKLNLINIVLFEFELKLMILMNLLNFSLMQSSKTLITKDFDN